MWHCAKIDIYAITEHNMHSFPDRSTGTSVCQDVGFVDMETRERMINNVMGLI